MNTGLWANRTVHTIVLSVVGFALVVGLRDILGIYQAALVATAPLVTWTLGRFHERALIVDTGLVDEDQIREASRNRDGLFSFDR